MSEYVMDYSGWAEGIPAVEYLKVCDAMHARKREEIVRCRDCRCFTPESTIRFPDGSTNEDFCSYFKAYKLQITPDGFCAWGERRQDNED